MSMKQLVPTVNLEDLSKVNEWEVFNQKNHFPICGNDLLGLPLTRNGFGLSVMDLLETFYTCVVEKFAQVRCEKRFKHGVMDTTFSLGLFLAYFGFLVGDGWNWSTANGYESYLQLGGLVWEGNQMILGALFYLLHKLKLFAVPWINEANKEWKIILDKRGKPVSITDVRNNFESHHLDKVSDLLTVGDVGAGKRMDWLRYTVDKLEEYFRLIPKVQSA